MTVHRSVTCNSNADMLNTSEASKCTVLQALIFKITTTHCHFYLHSLRTCQEDFAFRRLPQSTQYLQYIGLLFRNCFKVTQNDFPRCIKRFSEDDFSQGISSHDVVCQILQVNKGLNTSILPPSKVQTTTFLVSRFLK